MDSLKKKLGSLKRSSSKKDESTPQPPLSRRSPSNARMDSPFHVPTPTRRPPPPEAPPAYSRNDPNSQVSNLTDRMASTGLSPSASSANNVTVSDSSPYAFLAEFDTVFVIDDSGSMAGSRWRQTREALAAITPICTQHDADGVDIYFLNHRSNSNYGSPLKGYENVTAASAVHEIFHNVQPSGRTPTGKRLREIIRPYLSRLEAAMEECERTGEDASNIVKPLNIIVITDGVPTDEPEPVIVSAAKRLDKCDANPWQIGIQFFQVGDDPEAANNLRELDDALADEHDIRDIVDTVPWLGANGQQLTGDGILKVLLGAVNKKLDRKRGSDAELRR